MRLGMGRHLTPQQRRYRGRGIHVDTTSSSDLPRIMGKQKPKDPSYSDGNKEPPLPQLFFPFFRYSYYHMQSTEVAWGKGLRKDRARDTGKPTESHFQS